MALGKTQMYVIAVVAVVAGYYMWKKNKNNGVPAPTGGD